MTVWIIGTASVKRISFLNSTKTTNFSVKIEDKLFKSYFQFFLQFQIA
jgi:hypothetical protein